jgi:hypothetical protein
VIGSLSSEPTTMSMLEVERGLQGHIDRVTEHPGVRLTEVTEVETYAIPAGTAVRVSATFESGHALHRAWVVAEQKPVLFVTFATSIPYDESRPVFDAILESIAYLL